MAKFKLKFRFENGDGPIVRIVALIVAAILGVFIFVSYQAEANREPQILRYQKGTYLGTMEAPLTQEARDALRSRARLQGGSATPPGLR